MADRLVEALMWVKIDDGFFLHPKAQAAGKDGRALFLAGLCWCAGQLVDGEIPKPAVSTIAALAGVKTSAAKALVSAGLWHDEGDHYLVHDYLEYQASGAAERARRAEITRKRREAGQKGAESRWGHGKSGGKPVASAMANGKQPDGTDHGNAMAPSQSQSLSTQGFTQSSVPTAPMPSTDDDFERTVRTVAERQVARQLARRHDISDEAKYRAATIAGVRREHGDRIAADLARGFAPDEIAAQIAPTDHEQLASKLPPGVTPGQRLV